MPLGAFVSGVYEETGLRSLFASSRDVKLLCMQRFVRMFAYGSSTLILALFLSCLGFPDSKIGLFMSLTLFGDVFISLFLTLFADKLGRKAVLACGALLMVCSGVVFGFSERYWVLVAASVLGVISPSGNEIGPFRAIEESTLAQLVPGTQRSDIYAWYSLVGTAGIATGNITCGWVVQYLQNELGWERLAAYRVVFLFYAGLGLIKFILACALSKSVEVEKKEQILPTRSAGDAESTPLLQSDGAPTPTPRVENQRRSIRKFLPELSAESKVIALNLCLLFAMDSFASGLAPMSLISYFFKKKFAIQEGFLGSIFFTTGTIASASMLVASSLSKRIGNVKTMVFTHLPSAIFLALIPIPSSLQYALLFMILRACTQSMDGPPRSAFLAAILLPTERTAVMGTFNVVKTLSQSAGPLVTGVLSEKGKFWVAFVAAGSLKATYDLGMLALFAGHRDRERE